LFQHFMFDGIEGGGKDKKVEETALFLLAREIKPITTREPGGTPFGLSIRHAVLDPDTEKDPVALMTAFFAGRIELAQRVVKPALKQGKTVLQNRGVTSTYAYQVSTQEDPAVYKELSEIFFHYLDFYLKRELIVLPDFIFWLNLPVEQGLMRGRMISGQRDYFEDKDVKFHRLVQRGFEEIIQYLKSHYNVPYLEVDTSEEVSSEESQRIINLTVSEKLELTS